MKSIFSLLVGLFIQLALFGQVPEFSISDTTITECDGRLLDSGGEGVIYGLNENFTFTVCTESPISISFQNEFCLEAGFDFLSVYDGPDSSAPALAIELTGVDIPSSLSSTSGCATFVFTSDGSTSYCGFDLFWNSENIEPAPPVLSLLEDISCGSNMLSVSLTEAIPCTAIFPDFSSLQGQNTIDILSFNPLNCNDDGITDEFELTLSEPISYNCSFDLSLELGVLDNCDSLWIFNQSLNFLYDQCEFDIQFEVGEETLCNAECTTIEAIVAGCLTYQVSWNNGLPDGAGPHDVCPGGPVTYTATVLEVETGVIVTKSYIFEHESILIDQEDIQLCQSESPINLTASPNGGIWSGPGVSDEDFGYFDPEAAFDGENIIYYNIDGLSCYDSLIIILTEINAGDITASCPDIEPTQLFPTPPGGTWSGDGISPEGIFSPSTTEVYTITYDVNGCTETLFIDVRPFNSTLGIDPICQSANTQILETRPFGGFWSGPGIDDPYVGTWEPEWTGAGGIITLNYEAIGCSMEYEIEVIPAQIGSRYINTCPLTEPFPIDEFPNPPGGVYSGDGILDFDTGLFDPSSVANNNWYEIQYAAPNGCVDTLEIWVVDTSIPEDTAYFCLEDEALYLDNENTGREPWDGQWSGPGVVNIQDNEFDFTAALANIGEHLIYYDNNTCRDSILYIVYPNELDQDSITLCTADDPITLQELPSGSVWTGSGITDETAGIFDPGLTLGETITVTYSNPAGCEDEIVITVDEFIQAELSELEEEYCFNDIEVEVLATPEDGLLEGPEPSGIFNPSLLGEGTYTYTYSFPDYSCSADTSISFTIFPSSVIELTASNEVICDGGGTELSAEATSGIPSNNVTLEWSDGLIPISEHTVSPADDQYYYVTANDGCSDPVSDSILISVLEPITVEFSFGDTLCFDEEGALANSLILPEANYDVFWDDELGTETHSGLAGEVVDFYVINTDFGCDAEDIVLLPSHPPVTANFTINPNLECIPFEENPVSFIDISQNAVSGIWDFGNEETEEYDGSSPSMEYLTAGYYTVSLAVENSGGCVDTIFTEICINDPSTLFIPDIFSPNEDGFNDLLYVRGSGIIALEFSLYNSWGERVFYSEDPDEGWNGIVRGNKSPSGVYVYQLKARMLSGEEIEQSGDITLIR